MTGQNIVTHSRDGDAEVAASLDQHHLVCAGGRVEDDLAAARCRAEYASGGQCCFLLSGGRVGSLLAVAVLGVAAVLSVLASRSLISRPTHIRSASISSNSSLGAALCIVGQMSRLEIESKIRNIIEPLSKFTKVDVFLSLELGGDGHFFNAATSNVEVAHCRGSNLDADGVKAAFAPYFRGGAFENHSGVNVTLKRWPNLYKHLHGMSEHKRRSTISNNFCQMRHLNDCAELIKKSEESSGGKLYDIIVKVRDNTIALRPVVPQKLLSIREVTLKHCCWWGGVNDKVMALPREYLEKSLGTIYRSMLAVNNVDHDHLDLFLKDLSLSKNTEQILLFTLTGNKIPFRERTFEAGDRDGDDYLPFVDGRCSASGASAGEGRWCIVSHCKDCWPSTPWTYNVTCELAATGLEAPAASGPSASLEQAPAIPTPSARARARSTGDRARRLDRAAAAGPRRPAAPSPGPAAAAPPSGCRVGGRTTRAKEVHAF
ncbi:unnamed protein product [Prorocentrum cordatum]|uniref:Uncharacterized protein n=1 Tax=Prorocentrum cordatum TaxID=2364126 RepID=A0ABN9Q9L0_9DINO|nr:unnamed protein product [Polarella glacialis]